MSSHKSLFTSIIISLILSMPLGLILDISREMAIIWLEVNKIEIAQLTNLFLFILPASNQTGDYFYTKLVTLTPLLISICITYKKIEIIHYTFITSTLLINLYISAIIAYGMLALPFYSIFPLIPEIPNTSNIPSLILNITIICSILVLFYKIYKNFKSSKT